MEHSNRTEQHIDKSLLYTDNINKNTSIVGLHGFWGSGIDFISLQKELRSSYSMGSIDLLGFGKSPVSTETEDYTTQNLCKGIDEVLFPCHLLGYSMGARLALQYTLRYPQKVKSLICIGAHPGIQHGDEKEERRRWDCNWAEKFLKYAIEENLTEWMKIPILQSIARSKAWSTIQIRRQQQNPLGLHHAMLGFGTGIMPHCWNQLFSIQCPVLLIHGQYDRKYASIHQHMTEYNKNFSVREVLGSGHAPHIENPIKTAQIIQDWLP